MLCCMLRHITQVITFHDRAELAEPVNNNLLVLPCVPPTATVEELLLPQKGACGNPEI